MVLFVFFFVFELAPVHVNVEIDFILNVVTFPKLLPIFSSSVTEQALLLWCVFCSTSRTDCKNVFYFFYKLCVFLFHLFFSMSSGRGCQSCLVEEQAVNILGSGGYTVTVATTQLHYFSPSAATGNI